MPVERQLGINARAIPLRATGRHAYTRRRPGGRVVDEDVHALVRVAGDEIRGGAVEGHCRPVARYLDGGSVAVRLRTVRRDARAGRAAGHPIVDECIAPRVRVAGHQVARGAREGDVTAVGRDGGGQGTGEPVETGRSIRLGTVRGDADTRRGARDGVPDEDVHNGVRVARNEIRCLTQERDEAPVGGQDRRTAVAICLRAVGCHADTRRRAGRPIVDEDIPHAVGVSRDEIRRGAFERHEAAVGGHGWPVARSVRLQAAGRHTNPLGGPAESRAGAQR